MEYGAALDVLRVAVNVGSSLGNAGLETGLAPSMTMGTGFFGRSSLGENLHPQHFVQWTRLACNSDPSEVLGNFQGLNPWQSPAGPVPPYPVASNLAERGGRQNRPPAAAHQTPGPAAGTAARAAEAPGRDGTGYE
jgi:hypothetical protein